MKKLRTLLVLVLISFISHHVQSQDVIYVPTGDTVVNAMLKMANVNSSDIVYDLGSGDGRIVIAAAKNYGAKGVGIDIDPRRIEESNENAAEAGVTDSVEFIEADLFESDFSEATVITLYLLSSLNERLRPILMQQLKPGTRVVSHSFDMGDWKPEKTQIIDGSTIHLWTIPEKE